VGPALFWAVVTALVAFGIDAFFRYGLGVTFPAPEIHARIDVPWWRSGLASFWAPFAEEIVDRLFLSRSSPGWGMLGMKLFRVPERDADAGSRSGSPPWRTSLFFGWYHISNEQLFAAVLPPFVALRTVLIILPVGLAFGGSTSAAAWRR